MDVERTIRFLLEQQARFDARQAEFDARQAQFWQKFEEGVTQINSTMLSLATAEEKTNSILTTLAEKHLELAVAQRSTEEKLYAVISALERHIDNHP